MVASLLAAVFAARGAPLAMRRMASAMPRAAVVAVASPAAAAAGAAQAESVASVTYSLRPDLATGRSATYGENADKLVSSLPFDVGDVRFVVGAGGFLDGLHATVAQMEPGESKSGVSIDAGAGEYDEQQVLTVPIEQAPAGLKTGMAVQLQLGGGRRAQATVTDMNDETITLDANHPLAGCRLLMDVSLTALEPASAFETATFAGGCFWGLELAYQREPGVVGTAVGYTQGETDEPTYEAVCSGTTGHTEAVQVVYDPRVVGYERLCELRIRYKQQPTNLRPEQA